MRLWLDEYAYLDSPIHRWEPRFKLIALLALIFAFSFVRGLWLVPVMVLITIVLYGLSRLPVGFLVSRLRYPGIFLLALALILPLSGRTPLLDAGPVTLYEEGMLALLIIASRFVCILTVSLVLFGTAPFATTIKAMRSLGLPAILADMMMLSLRYIFEIGDRLERMERAMRLRGFRGSRFNWRNLRVLASMAGSIFVRSYEQADRVYKAMQLRGYAYQQSKERIIESTGQILTVDSVCFSYPGQPPVLDGVSLTVVSGERVGLIGPNGAGKTSLFLIICGVLKANAGAVTLLGEAMQYGDFRPEIGFVFQNPDDQLFSPTVRDDVAFGPQNMGLTDDVVEARVAAALETTGTTELADRAPHHLSGGEKRMVSIATTLAMEPVLMIYDEPDANLDSRSRRRLIRFLQASVQPIMVASHDLELILEVCTRVLLLDDGQIVANGEPRSIMGNAALMEAHGLEKPHSLVPHVEPHHHKE